MHTTKLTLIVAASALMQGCSTLGETSRPGHQDLARSASFRYANDAALPEVQAALAAVAEPEQHATDYRPVPVRIPVAAEPAQPVRLAKHKHRQGSANPIQAIESANRDARQSPDAAGFNNAVMNYDYSAGALYQIHAAPLRLTDIQLEPGEEILGKPAAGDTVRWVLGVNKSVEDGLTRQHVLVKPAEANLTTTLIINTNRRTYLLELASHKETYMAAVSWHYPQQAQRVSLDRLKAQAWRPPSRPAIDLDNLNFAYRVERQQGQPLWTPTRVFDDGQQVFIRFPAGFQQGEAPVLYVRARDGQNQMVNYRIRNGYYIVDRLFAAAELRVGSGQPEVVRIARLG